MKKNKLLTKEITNPFLQLKDMICHAIEDNRSIKERIPVGLHCFIGSQGAGKTSLMTAMMCNDYKYHHLERFDECQIFTKGLNKNGFHLHLPKNKCLYYSPEPIVLSKKPYVETWKCYPERFALPNMDFKVQYFPRGSVIMIPEFDKLVNCRDWQSLSPYLVALAKYARHWDLVILLDFQVWLQLDVSWRRLMMWCNYVTDRFNVRYFWFKPKKIWSVVTVCVQQKEFAKDLKGIVGEDKLYKHVMSNAIFYRRLCYKKGDEIYTRYNSTSGEAYFLAGIDDYEYVGHNHTVLTPEGVNQFIVDNPLVRSNETIKKRRNS